MLSYICLKLLQQFLQCTFHRHNVAGKKSGSIFHSTGKQFSVRHIPCGHMVVVNRDHSVLHSIAIVCIVKTGSQIQNGNIRHLFQETSVFITIDQPEAYPVFYFFKIREKRDIDLFTHGIFSVHRNDLPDNIRKCRTFLIGL